MAFVLESESPRRVNRRNYRGKCIARRRTTEEDIRDIQGRRDRRHFLRVERFVLVVARQRVRLIIAPVPESIAGHDAGVLRLLSGIVRVGTPGSVVFRLVSGRRALV